MDYHQILKPFTMKFSITKLESARPDPIAFIKNLEDEGGYGYPKSLRWLDSACEYHRTNNLSHSINYLQNKFISRNRTQQNIKEEEKLTQSLVHYIEEHNHLKYTYKSNRMRLDIKLSDKLEIGGLIWLINTTAEGGYTTYTITDSDNIYWQNELRFPIIQKFLSNKFKCNSDNVAIGVINYTSGKREQRCYSTDDILIAEEELNDIGAKISSVL